MRFDTSRGWRLLPHTADLIVEAWGPDVVACAAEAARALIGICVAGTPDADAGQWVASISGARDVVRDVLDEVVFVLDTSDLPPVSVRLERSGDSDVELRLGLAPRGAVLLTGAAPKAIVMLDPASPPGDGLERRRFIVDV